MAGLLDIFGTSGQETMGLLGMSPEDIGRSRDDAQAQALYALAGRLFQGGRGASSVVEGLQQGQQAYRTAMQGGLQQQLQNYQLQELLKKKQLEEQQRKEELMARQLFMRGYQPAVAGKESMPIEEDGRFIGDSQAIAARPARFDIGSIAPELMAIGPAGQAKLKAGLDLQKSMRPEQFSLAEGATQFERDPFTGLTKSVATGLPKKEKPDIAGDVKEARQVLGILTPVDEMTATERASVKAYIDRKDAGKAPKVSVDLKDPTAIAKAQSDVIKDWRGVVKDVGAMEVADRFKAAKSAVAEGNAGNKSADGALIYAIGKIYDPSGAVQEGDKATILGNRSIPQSIQAYAQRALNGQSLLPEERAGLLSVASKVVESKARNLEAQKAPYTSISQQLGGNGSLLLNPLADALNAPIERSVGMPTAADIQAEIARRRGR
jgi:hypothetical protein